jgi:hypothetical protein
VGELGSRLQALGSRLSALGSRLSAISSSLLADSHSDLLIVIPTEGRNLLFSCCGLNCGSQGLALQFLLKPLHCSRDFFDEMVVPLLAAKPEVVTRAFGVDDPSLPRNESDGLLDLF